MKIETQLISFILFFVFGVLLSFIYFAFLQKRKKLCYLVSIVMTLCFVYALYCTNGGQIHPYFFIVNIHIYMCITFEDKTLKISYSQSYPQFPHKKIKSGKEQKKKNLD